MQHCWMADWRIYVVRLVIISIAEVTQKQKQPHLYSSSYLVDIISNILLASPFKRDFCAYNAHKDTNLILSLVDLVITPTEKDI